MTRSLAHMKTKQLVLHSAVTIVATGLTLLSSSTSEASGRGPSGMRMSGGRGAHVSHEPAIRAQQPRTERATMNRMQRRDDRGGHGERERRHGHDDGIRHDASINRGERERERRHGKDDRIRHDASVTRGEREREHRHGNDDRKVMIPASLVASGKASVGTAKMMAGATTEETTTAGITSRVIAKINTTTNGGKNECGGDTESPPLFFCRTLRETFFID